MRINYKLYCLIGFRRLSRDVGLIVCLYFNDSMIAFLTFKSHNLLITRLKILPHECSAYFKYMSHKRFPLPENALKISSHLKLSFQFHF